MRAHPSINLPERIEMWPEGNTPFASDEDGVFPTLTLYLPSEECRTGDAVLILPGGGYGMVSTAKEGHRPAQFLSSHGIAAAVLEYRHAPQRHPVPLLDAQRGLRHLRAFAAEHGLNTDRVGVLGFSAGGHLAGSLMTQPEVKEGRVGDALDKVSCHPDFGALLYPVVSFVADYAHTGSCRNLLGETPDPELAERLSIERAVTSTTPPAFIVHTQTDNAVPIQNALALAGALVEHGVPTELHMYPETPNDKHGFGMGANHPWCSAFLEWLERGHSHP